MDLAAALIELSQRVRALAHVVERLEENVAYDEDPTENGRDIALALKALERKIQSEGLVLNGGGS